MVGENRQTRRTYLKTIGVVGVGGGVTGAGSAAARRDSVRTDGTERDSVRTDETRQGAIQMGSLVPVTGAASPYGEGMQKAVNLAVQDVNEAGGPLGRPIQMHNRDSETKPGKAVVKLRTLISENGIVGFVGAFSSGVSTTLAPVVADSGVMEVSHGSTSPVLSEAGYRDGVKFFGRTSPNDAQQGIVMARAMENQIEADTAAFLYVDNPYGAGLAQKASQSFGGETTASVGYAQGTTDYTSTLDEVFQNDPDAVGFVGYPGNARTIFQQWANGGYGGQWVLSEAVNSPEFIRSLGEILEGMYVTSPDPEKTTGASRFREKIGDSNTLFAPHAYDAVFLQALAIEQADEVSGAAIARNIQSVSRPPGMTVTVDEFSRAKKLLAEGEQVNYQGASSPVDLNDRLEPLNRFALLQISNGATKTVETVPRSFFEGKLYDEGADGGTTGGTTTAES